MPAHRAENALLHLLGVTRASTLLAGITPEGMTAPFVVEGAVTTAVMEAYLQQVLLPTLHVGDILILDNLSVHQAACVTRLLTAHECRVLFLPAYSPDFSPIENAFAKIKAILPRLRAQTLEALLEAIVQALDAITPWDAIGYFSNAGFLNLDSVDHDFVSAYRSGCSP